MVEIVNITNFYTCAKEFQITLKGDSLDELNQCIWQIQEIVKNTNKGETV